MALENKKLKQTKQDYLINQTIDDRQDANKNDTLSKAITAGLVIAGGVALYKSGVLRPVFGALKETGAAFAEMSSNQGYHRSKAMKNWANGRTGEFLRPDHSLFNPKKSTSLGYDLWQDLKESLNRGELYSTNTRRIINDTVADVNILNQMIEKETKGFTKADIEAIRKEVEEKLDGKPRELIESTIKKREDALKKRGKRNIKLRNASLKESSFIKGTYMMNDMMLEMDRANLNMAGNKASSDLMKSFVRRMSLDDNTAQYQLKRTGYRTLTLGDIFEGFDEKNKSLVFKKGLDEQVLLDEYKINLNETLGKNEKTVKETIESFLKDSRYVYEEGERVGTIGNFDDVWKKFIIDPSININAKNNKVINYMMGQDALTFFTNSIRKDFGLPVLGFNPIDIAIKITPLDNMFNRRDIPFALINGVGNYSPYISGKGGRAGDDISTALQKRFNNFDETFHLLFADGDLYALGTGGTKEFIGSGFHAWDISDVDKKFKMPHHVETMRQMANYHLNKDVREDIPFANLTFSQKIRKRIGDILDIGHQEFVSLSDGGAGNIGDSFNPDNAFDDLLDKVSHSNLFKTDNFQYATYEEAASNIRDKSYNMAFGKGFDDFITKNGTKIRGKNIILTKQGINFSDLIQDAKDKNQEKFVDDLKGFWTAFFSFFWF